MRVTTIRQRRLERSGGIEVSTDVYDIHSLLWPVLALGHVENKKSNEWYTPAKYIEAAREVMGGIDLDPASCWEANQAVKASKYYSIEDNGLAQEWRAECVWLNPPYGNDSTWPHGKRSGLARWALKALEEYQKGNIKQCIMLLLARTDQHWFKSIWNYPICFSDHSVRFFLPHKSTHLPGRNFDSHMWGTCFVYLGTHEQKFIDIFSQFGRIAKAVDTPRQAVVPLPLWETH